MRQTTICIKDRLLIGIRLTLTKKKTIKLMRLIENFKKGKTCVRLNYKL